MAAARGEALAAALAEAIRLFDVPADDVAPLLAAHDAVCRDDRLRRWVTAAAEPLRAAMGDPSPGPVLDRRPDAPTEVARYLPVLVLADLLPDTRALHRSLGVAPDVTAATLADVGRMLVRNRVWEGEPGLGDELAGWLTRHLHGALFQIGRLQYERVLLGQGLGAELRMSGFPCGPGDLTLNLHIPETGARLDPEAVGSSLTVARTFFRRRFRDERPVGMTCHSWLLDPQLADYLPADSNVVAFQRRFTLGRPRAEDGDLSVRKFVFGDTTTPVRSLPQRTRLEKAVVRHLRTGRHWHIRSGWLPAG